MSLRRELHAAERRARGGQAPYRLRGPIGGGFFGGGGFNGDFTSILRGVNESFQTDCGIDYGTTLLPSAGNTATSVLSFAGLIAGKTVPIWAKATNTLAIGSGAAFNIYYDGLGVTPAMVGVVPAVATPVALTGAGFGLTMAWAAGTSVINNIWKATARVWADQSGFGWHTVQPTASQQLLITAGLNGYCGLLSDGVTQQFPASFINGAPGTTPIYRGAVFRQVTFSGTAGRVIGSANDFGVIYSVGPTPILSAYNGAGVPNGGAPVNTWVDCEWEMTNNAGDMFKLGSTVAHGTAGNTAMGSAIFGGDATVKANVEFLQYFSTHVLPDWPTYRQAIATKYGVGAVLT